LFLVFSYHQQRVSQRALLIHKTKVPFIIKLNQP
jgi:hypothetical protein